MKARLALSFLGGFEARLVGAPVDAFESDKVRALLAYLAVESDHVHTRAKLADLLWPDLPERRGRQNLSQVLYNLKKVICDRQAAQPCLNISSRAIELNPEGDTWVDSKAFTMLIEDCLEHPHLLIEDCEECRLRLQQAVDLYGGEFLSGFSLNHNISFYEWMLVNRERLQRLMMNALSKLTRCYEARGALDLAATYAWRQVELNPLWEAGHRQYIRLMAAQGRRSAALAHYDRLCQTLKTELNVSPDPETLKLVEGIRAQKEAPVTGQNGLHNLPASLTPLIGRESELEALQKRLNDPYCRLLTVLGPGGSGKTRLALETARNIAHHFPHGVYLVSMGTISTPEDLPTAVGHVLKFPLVKDRDPAQQIFDYLRNKEALLLMDSFEHLLDGVVWTLALLRAAPGVRVLATSRAKLRAKGEHLFPLEGLPYPERGHSEKTAQSAALRLFESGARRVDPEFKLEREKMEGVIQVCRTVRGMPLGILLASSFMDMYTPAEVAEEMGRGLAFLATDWQDVPARQRSMRAVFDYSWRLISPREREIYQGLSVFLGGFWPQAAAYVTGATTRELKALVDKTLVHRSAEGRFELHDLSRQYAAEKLAENGDVLHQVRDRHSAYFLRMLEEKEAHLKDRRQQTALDELDKDRGNLREAWEWVVSQGGIANLETALDGLCRYCDLRIRFEAGKNACQVVLDRIETTSQDLLLMKAQCLTWQGRFYRYLGESEIAEKLFGKSQSILKMLDGACLGVQRQIACVCVEQGHLVVNADRKAALEWHRKALLVYQKIDDQLEKAGALINIAKIAEMQGDYERVQRFANEALIVFRAIGSERQVAKALELLGYHFFWQGDLREGEKCITESLNIWEEIEDPAGIAKGLDLLAKIKAWSGNLSESLPLAEKSLEYYEDLGFNTNVGFMKAGVVMLNLLLGRYDRVEEDGPNALLRTKELNYPYGTGVVLMMLAGLDVVQSAYEHAEPLLQKSIKTLRSLGQRVEVVMALSILGYAYRGMGRPLDAWQSLINALNIAVETNARSFINFALAGVALMVLDEGEVVQALSLYALANTFPMLSNSQFIEDVAGKYIMQRAMELPKNVVSQAQERGQDSDLIATAKKILDWRIACATDQ